MTPHDTAKLTGVHPLLIEKVGFVLDAMSALGFPMMVTDGLRTVEQQRALYAQGRSAPGHVVTVQMILASVGTWIGVKAAQ